MGTKRGQGPKRTCVICKIVFNVVGNRVTCSTACSNKRVGRINWLKNEYILCKGEYIRLSGAAIIKHPASRGNKTISQHVAYAFNKYGFGPHKCYWCNCDIDWFFGIRKPTGEIKKIYVDHLNWVKIDNRSDNLVLSCVKCNWMRGNDGLSDSDRNKRMHQMHLAYNSRVNCTGCNEILVNFYAYRSHRNRCRKGQLVFL